MELRTVLEKTPTVVASVGAAHCAKIKFESYILKVDVRPAARRRGGGGLGTRRHCVREESPEHRAKSSEQPDGRPVSQTSGPRNAEISRRLFVSRNESPTGGSGVCLAWNNAAAASASAAAAAATGK